MVAHMMSDAQVRIGLVNYAISSGQMQKAIDGVEVPAELVVIAATDDSQGMGNQAIRILEGLPNSATASLVVCAGQMLTLLQILAAPLDVAADIIQMRDDAGYMPVLVFYGDGCQRCAVDCDHIRQCSKHGTPDLPDGWQIATHIRTAADIARVGRRARAKRSGR